MRNAARGLVAALLLTVSVGPAAAADHLPIAPGAGAAAPALMPSAPASAPTTAPLQLAEPAPLISPPQPSPNGIYSVSPPSSDPCNTNVAVVQQSGCQ